MARILYGVFIFWTRGLQARLTWESTDGGGFHIFLVGCGDVETYGYVILLF